MDPDAERAAQVDDQWTSLIQGSRSLEDVSQWARETLRQDPLSNRVITEGLTSLLGYARAQHNLPELLPEIIARHRAWKEDLRSYGEDSDEWMKQAMLKKLQNFINRHGDEKGAELARKLAPEYRITDQNMRDLQWHGEVPTGLI